jgi:hypothetical protein
MNLAVNESLVSIRDDWIVRSIESHEFFCMDRAKVKQYFSDEKSASPIKAVPR